jgi:hypothetical protein
MFAHAISSTSATMIMTIRSGFSNCRRRPRSIPVAAGGRAIV